MENEALPLTEAAKLIGIPYIRAFRFCKRGQLRCQHQRTEIMVSRADAESFRRALTAGRRWHDRLLQLKALRLRLIQQWHATNRRIVRHLKKKPPRHFRRRAYRRGSRD